MKRFAWVAYGLVLCLCVSPVLAVNIDRETVKIRAVEPPLVNVAVIDFNGLTAEVAFGEIRIGEPVLGTTKSICTPEHSENKIKDAIELPTHYYEIPFKTESGVVVVSDAVGRVVHTARLDALESNERFGYDQCRYWFKPNLEEDFAGKLITIERSIENHVAEYFSNSATRAMDEALFFNVLEERVPLYRFKDKNHDYADLNRAFELAQRGYSSGAAGETDLWGAVEIWEAALGQSELNDKTARINRKVTVKLHESVGIAHLVLGDYTAAVDNLEKSRRYSSMTTSRSGGTGSQDLILRARERKHRDRKNPDLPTDPVELETLVTSVERFRGRVPVRVLPTSELQRLRTEHASAAIGDAVVAHLEEANEQQAAIEAGRENRYERQVGRTTSQGFYLFLMPYGNKLDEFPQEVCELTHLNQLRMPKHGFNSVPAEIGNLSNLKMLDLSGNNIERLPDSIANLTKLKTLKIKDNPLAPGELERIQSLLPGCKIKG